MISMTRRVSFSAAHADWVFSLTAAENRERFGELAGPEPHGHNFVLDVTVEGEIDSRTGIIVNIKEIDRIVRERVVRPLGGVFINRQTPEFCDWPATPENIARFAADALRHELHGATLTTVRVEDTPLSFVELRTGGGNEETMQFTRVYEFAASHRLHSPQLTEAENRELFGKCNYEHGHGHNYVLEVTVEGPIDERSGRAIDPDALDAVVNREVVERYDHRHLNYDIPEFRGKIPSTELVVKVAYERLEPYIPAPARLVKVVIRETARNFFEYAGTESR